MGKILSRIRSIVVLNGALPAAVKLQELAKQHEGRIIAADGAAWSLMRSGVLPSIIVGDLDSLRASPDSEEVFSNSEIVELPDQETNDFEKALSLVERRGLGPVLVLGMQGGDLEHSFNNWSVSIKFAQRLEVWILEDNRIGIGLCGYMKASCAHDKMVSLIPQPFCDLSTKGLVWELNNERLALGVREGARNLVVESDFEINVSAGSVLVFVHQDTQIDSLTVRP